MCLCLMPLFEHGYHFVACYGQSMAELYRNTASAAALSEHANGGRVTDREYTEQNPLTP